MGYTPQIRAYLRSNHRCIQCRTQDAFTLNGRSRCAECAGKLRGYNKRCYDKSQKKCQKAYYDKHKEKGLCVSCGKRPAKPGRVRCEICLAKSRLNIGKMRQKNSMEKIESGLMNYPRGENGYCYLCNRNPAADGQRLCAECLAKLRKTSELRRCP